MKIKIFFFLIIVYGIMVGEESVTNVTENFNWWSFKYSELM